MAVAQLRGHYQVWMRLRTFFYKLLDLQISWVHRFMKSEGMIEESSTHVPGEEIERLKFSVKQWLYEQKTHLSNEYRNQSHQESLTLFKFDSADVVRQWVSMGDGDMGGKSNSKLALGANKKLLWTGNVSTAVPRDGITFQSGYVGIRSRLFMASFYRDGVLDLKPWNVIEIRLRGDGRRYHFNLQIDEQFDATYEDLYFHPIFTRGGPYWEVVQIPFSHLVLSNKGMICRQTTAVDRSMVRNIGFSLVEHFEGPFRLEVDYIKFITDDAHRQACAYEFAGSTHGMDWGSKYGKV